MAPVMIMIIMIISCNTFVLPMRRSKQRLGYNDNQLREHVRSHCHNQTRTGSHAKDTCVRAVVYHKEGEVNQWAGGAIAHDSVVRPPVRLRLVSRSSSLMVCLHQGVQSVRRGGRRPAHRHDASSVHRSLRCHRSLPPRLPCMHACRGNAFAPGRVRTGCARSGLGALPAHSSAPPSGDAQHLRLVTLLSRE